MNTQMKTNRWSNLNRCATIAAAAALLCAAPSAWSLGLGRLSVKSAVGEPLRAEIDVTSLTPEEAAALSARVAPPESYRVAGIDYSPVLPTTRVSLQRRADGSAYLRVTSDRAVQEPFVDVILELAWASGRLSREYTLLFDPPASNRTPSAPVANTLPVAPEPVAPPPVARVPAAPVERAPAPAPAPVRERAEARQESAASEPAPARRRAATPARAERSSGESYRVRPGDTLYSIASRNQASGVSLDQMLVSLYRNNESAFLRQNMNRLRAGAVLNIPNAEQAGKVSPSAARRVISTHSSDFSGYRSRLAKAVPPSGETAEPSRRVTGTVQTEVEDRKQAATPTPDRLKLDKGVTASSAPSLEDKVAKARAAREAATREEELKRNVEALKQLQGASGSVVGAASSGVGLAVGKVTQGAASAAKGAASAVTAAASAVAEKASVAAAPASAPAEVKPVEAAPSAPSAPVVQAPASVAVAPVKPPVVEEKPALLPVTDAEEPSLLSQITESPFALPGAGLILAGLVGLGWYRFRGRSKDEPGVTSFLESHHQPDSFFGASGGQRVDTRDSSTGAPSSMSYSLSQIDAIGDVDPVAEADVYLAYGRDLQAEEILKEAMRANPDRLAIRTKLLEVYAKRRDTKGFELLAGELYGLTGGQGDDWAKAQEMGRSIDPENPLYEPGGQPAAGSVAEAGGGEMLGASTMPHSVVPPVSRLDVTAPDLNLDVDSGPISSMDMDLDISAPGPITELPTTGFQVSDVPDLDLSAPSLPGGGVDSASLDFELSDIPAAPVTTTSAPTLDLSDISLDLDEPVSAPAAPSGMSTSGMGLTGLDDLDDDLDPLARKLELAEEFQQIGDYEGARDLLAEVVEKAEGPLKAKAQSLLDNLG